MRKTILISLFLSLCAVPLAAQKINMEKLKGMKPRSIGPAGMSGRITSIDVVHTNPDIIYAGAASGGVWKTINGGTHWKPMFDKQTVLSIGALAIQQDNPSVVWAGTGEGNPRNSLNGGFGIYKTLDGGKTWQLMGLENTRNIHRIIIHPKNPDIVYVGAIGSPWGEHPERGVYKTTDGGKNWTKVLYVNEKTGCADLVMDPGNPNKLFAAMWEHRRKPWTFNSGGSGSGMHVTHDGGHTWKKLTDKEGLPKGDLGRIGMAVAASNTEVVYALIENKKNALYRSTDGGHKWKKVNDKMSEIGNRPFYYCDIYVDPLNENRLYTIYSEVNVSIDGGKSFQKLLPYSGVHPDHHAWYIHPTDPSFMIDGNDGGLNITYDYGETWRFVENIPVGQFYHISVDNDYPYNVYGGLQDNGSWVGPAYVWKDDGIRNAYWQVVMFGDGFDVQADPDDNRYGYAMWQKGNLGRYDRKTGATQYIRPTVADENVRLRFNWNAAIALDPFDNASVYFGSQFVHLSHDKGTTWTVISPDLTTNDTEKQKQSDSGGLTIDATGAENFCSILAIAPSPLERGTLWVGTDDGQLQLTRDGGKNWTNLSANIAGMPRNAWIPQVVPSTYNPAEVWVVVNNYRQFDFKPYLYHSTDYGKTWTSVASSAKLSPNAYTLAFAQDPVEKNLLFLGTDNGLFVSIDGGKNFTRWTSGYPHGLNTMDMVIHPREYDLVIGSFGRAIYVLDDIRPLREMARAGNALLDKPLHLFSPPNAYQVVYQDPAGVLFPGNAVFKGENRKRGALISYVVNKPAANKSEAADDASVKKKKGKKKNKRAAETTVEEPKADTVKTKIVYDSLVLEVLNAQDRVIRTLKKKAPKEDGVNRMVWRTDEKGYPRPSRKKKKASSREPSGIQVMPGKYKLRMTFGEFKDSTTIEVKPDPRYQVSLVDQKARYDMGKQIQQMKGICTMAMERLVSAKGEVSAFEKKLKARKDDGLKEALENTKAVKDTIGLLMDFIVGKEDKRQGLVRSTDPNPVSVIRTASFYIGSTRKAISDTDRMEFSKAKRQADMVKEKVNGFFAGQWKAYVDAMEQVKLERFKTFEPLKE